MVKTKSAKSAKSKTTTRVKEPLKFLSPPKALFVGIDPGVNGAIVGIWGQDILTCLKMPKTEYDILDCIDELGINDEESPIARLEWIHPSIYGISKGDMSKLYGNYMQLRMALAASRLRWETTRAQDWQQALGIARRRKTENTTRWKNRLKARAQQLFPQEKVTLWNCDALLIATYCQRFEQGQLK